MTNQQLVQEVVAVIIDALGLDSGVTMDAETPLLDHLPELDSMAIVQLIAEIEDRFAISIDEDEISGDIFETVGALAGFVEAQRSSV
jgi:acyl carrier protein